MIENIPSYIDQLEEIRDKIQDKIDNQKECKYNSQQEKQDEAINRYEEQIDLIENIISSLNETNEYIGEFDSQFRGLKSVK